MSAFAFAPRGDSADGGYRRSSRSIVLIACCVSVATLYTSVRRGIGEPSLENIGKRPHTGSPTGSTGAGDIPFTTPAADVYQATAAVMIPTHPPACVIHAEPPCASLKKPITRRTSVICNVRKTRNVATLIRALQRSM